MIIAQISDTHIALDTPDADRRIGDFERTIADINSLDPAPDVIVHSGDVVHNGRQDEYAQAVATSGKANAPVFAIVGNKDNRENFHSAFAKAGYLSSDSGFVTYSVDDYPVRLVMLDTLDPEGNKGEFCDERFAGLEELLEPEPVKPTLIFMHHPPFDVPVGPAPLNFKSRDTMQRLRQVLQDYGNVIGVFSGHVHRAAFGDVGRIPASVMTSVATTLRWGEYSHEMSARPVYHIHRYDPGVGFVTETRIVMTI